jgi:hypothetical protein
LQDNTSRHVIGACRRLITGDLERQCAGLGAFGGEALRDEKRGLLICADNSDDRARGSNR